MPDAKTPLLDIRPFLAVQRQQQYQAFVLHAPPDKDAERRRFAAKLAALEPGGVYLDVLAHVAADPALCRTIDLLDVPFLRRLALDAAAAGGARLVVVDEFDFLAPVWGDDLAGLHELVRKLRRGETDAVLVFSLRTRPALEAWRLVNDRGQSRVLSLSSLQNLP